MKIRNAAFAAFATSFLAGTALAGAPDGSWYIAPQVQGLWLDDARVADDDLGASLAFGHTLNQNWDFQISLFGSEHKRAGNNNTMELQGLAVGVNRIFYREGRVNPFLSIGLGHTKSIGKPGSMRPSSAPCMARAYSSSSARRSGDGNVMALRARSRCTARPGKQQRRQQARRLRCRPRHPVFVGRHAGRRVVDTDGDGVTDDMDKCPGTPAGTAVDSDGCPLPQDDDGDGVTNDIDKCPGTPAGAKVDASGCELDSDGDGVVDSRDQCPERRPRARRSTTKAASSTATATA